MEGPSIKKIAIVGSGVAGLTAAYLLHDRLEVTLFEKNHYIGGHTNTIEIPSGPDEGIAVDTGFIVYNERNYPVFIRLLDDLGIQGMPSDMSFGFSGNGIEYSSYFPKGVFAQRRNMLRPSFLGMLRDILRFNKRALTDLQDGVLRLRKLTLGRYLEEIGMGRAFRDHYLLPMTAAIWSTSPKEMLDFPALTFAHFFRNHGLLTTGKRPQWRTIPGGAKNYVDLILKKLRGQYFVNRPVASVRRKSERVHVRLESGEEQVFDAVIMATHADEALALLSDPSYDEKILLGPWNYTRNRAILHTDTSLMPRRTDAWASWNYTSEGGSDDRKQVTLTYHMNRLQSLLTSTDYFVTLNPRRDIPKDKVVLELEYTHPRFTFEALTTQPELPILNKKKRTWFCGSYFKYGFHEDAVSSAAVVARDFGAYL